MKTIQRKKKTGRVVGTWAVVALCLLSTGCASFATLEGVVADTHNATPAEMQEVEILREGSRLPVSLNMALKKGDVIKTSPRTQVEIEFTGGYLVTLNSETEIEILNPSIFMRIGQLFVEKIGELKKKFEGETKYVKLSDKGTAFLLGIDANDVVTCTVVEGEVEVTFKEAPVGQITYRRLQQVVIAGNRPPEVARTLGNEDIEGATTWVPEVKRLTIRTVPSLHGQLLEEARGILEEQQLSVGRIRPRITGQARPGTVVDQDPPPDSPLRAGSSVDLWIERESAVVPDVGGVPLDEAQGLLRERGLVVGPVTERLREGVRDGMVLSQKPRSGNRVDLGTRVTLEVAIAGVRVPDLRNVAERDVVAMLEEAGLRVGRTDRQVTRGRQPGTVQQQTPKQGTLVRVGSVIDLVFAGAPRECTVPPLGGLTRERAEVVLERAGLGIGKVNVAGVRREFMSMQRPEEGTVVPCGTPVDLWFGTIE